MNKFLRTKSYTGSKFSKKFFEQLYRMDCGCTPMLQFFSVASDGATTAPNLELRFCHFFPLWGRIASPIMHGFGRCFRLENWMCFTMH